MRHIIKKQVIELSLDKRLNYFHVRQQVSDRYWNEIVPILEKSFDAISSEEELIEIDRFELDLGVISEKDLGSRELMREIRRKIEQKVTAIPDPRYAVDHVTPCWAFSINGYFTWTMVILHGTVKNPVINGTRMSWKFLGQIPAVMNPQE